jgi:predicted SAM-dependent methyltransferase
MLRLNIGCGPAHQKKGWYNIDVRPFPGVDEVRDATIPFDDLSPVEYIYCEHFLEHLSLEGALLFLRNSASALVPSGRIRLSTPALEWVLATHFDLAETFEDRIIQATLVINRAFHGWGHQFVWSKPMLHAALVAVGFQDIRFWTYGQSDDPVLVGLEEHGDFHISKGWPSVWVAEGVRGSRVVENMNFMHRCEVEFQCHVRSGH